MNKRFKDSYSPYRIVLLMFCPAIISALSAYYAWDMVGAAGAIFIQISVLLIFKFVIDRNGHYLLNK